VEAVEDYIEEQRQIFRVQGLGVAVVQDGEVVLSRGFGERDTKRSVPVTADTIFSIGSSTKAFTASLVGALVDDGLLEWDKPVREYLPWFRMYDPIASELMTPRDLLCHRSGLPRHDFLWYNNQHASREDLIRRLPHLENSKTFREVWQYNNLMYLTAGYLSGELLGCSWEDAVQQRLLDPLGMTNTNFSVSESQKSDDFSLPYTEKDDEVIEIPFRPIDLVGPAGSINSSITDMTKWVAAQVNGGMAGTTPVISPAALKELHAPTMVMPEVQRQYDETYDSGYALGWFVANYRGVKLVHHGGNIDGFSALVSFLPSQNVGVVVLSNMNGTPFPTVATYRVLDEVLGLEPLPWGQRVKAQVDAVQSGAKEAKAHREAKSKDAPPSHELADYTGDYRHAGYGSFAVSLVEDRLVPHYNDLDLTIEHRHYDVWDVGMQPSGDIITISFGSDLEGNVATLTAVLEATVAPIIFEKQPERGLSDPAVLRRYEGTFAMGPATLVVTIGREGSLVATISGSVLELVPYEERTFAVKGHAGTKIEFVVADDGSVEKVIAPGAVFTPVSRDDEPGVGV